MMTLPQGRHECKICYDRDNNHEREKAKLNAPERYDYQRGNEEGDGDIFFDMPHKN